MVKRLALSIARYLTRARGRATPFGAFAGVGPLTFGPNPDVGSEKPSLVMRADSAWTGAVISRVEALPHVRAVVPWRANDALLHHGEQLVVAALPHGSAMALRASAVSVRRTEVLEYLMEVVGAGPLCGADVVRTLDARFPGHPARVWETLIGRLAEHGLLVSALRPSARCTDGLAHVVEVLHRYGLGELSLVSTLRRVQHQLGAGAPVPSTRALMRTVTDTVDQPVTATMRVAGARLPVAVAQEAADVASVLWRASPSPGGTVWLREFHDRFVGRYGAGALVPVTALVDPARGLGMPEFSEHGQAEKVVSGRDRVLLDWAYRAALDGAREVVVSAPMLDQLTAETEASPPAAHLEVCAQVLAPTLQALDQGWFGLWVHGVSRSAMALSGRFVDLLDEEHRRKLLEQYRQVPTTVEAATPVHLSFPPRHLRLENVTGTARLLPQVLSVGEYHPGDVPGVADLAVTAERNRLFLVSLSQRCVVEPVVTHAASRLSWPPLVRLLWEVGRSGSATVAPWSWGSAASGLPFLPRVRYGRSVLAPARWRLDPGGLPPVAAPRQAWDRALDLVREERDWPRWVSVGEKDRRLRLDLEAPMDRAVLRDHLNRSTAEVVVSETPAPEEHGWNAGLAHEVVVPVVSVVPPSPAPRALTAAGAPVPLAEEHVDFPGQGVLTVHLAGPPDQVDTIVTRHLPDLLATLGAPASPWWFVRYRHPEHHLRLRLHHADHGAALSAVHTWARTLYRQGLVGAVSLHPYRPETARYGSGEAMAAAEMVFAADSATVHAHLLMSGAHREIDRQALAAASMVHLARALAPTPEQGERWLLDRPRSGPALPREAARQAVRWADLDTAALTDLTYGAQVAHAWKQRADACDRYARALTGPVVTPSRVLGSLLHMHHNRMLGINPDSERVVTRMARGVALSRQARKGTR